MKICSLQRRDASVAAAERPAMPSPEENVRMHGMVTSGGGSWNGARRTRDLAHACALHISVVHICACPLPDAFPVSVHCQVDALALIECT
mmetsp:Transcript_25037/g.58355  ORF Transcript_25037/g.58355 Transcript_25037/m.58355 type:complete len:90 (-) Transcript_25037:399-668(-)